MDVVPDRVRWMTVDAAPRQPGLFDGTAAFRADPAGREVDLVGLAPGMSCTADLRVSAPEAHAVEHARDRIRIVRVNW